MKKLVLAVAFMTTSFGFAQYNGYYTPSVHLDPIGFTPLDKPSKWISFKTPKPKFDDELFLTEMGGSRVSNNIAHHLQRGDNALALSNLGRNPRGIDTSSKVYPSNNYRGNTKTSSYSRGKKK